MAKVGYARVSSVGQSLDVQREKLGGCDKLFEEKRSGTTDARPMLKQCLGYVREGDQLIVTRIDRLARSTLHLCQIAETLRKKGVDLVVLDQNIDTSDATGRLLFNMLGAIGQFETQIRAERQMDGYPAHVRTRKSFGDMTRKLSDTSSHKSPQFLGTSSFRNPSMASQNSLKVA